MWVCMCQPPDPGLRKTLRGLMPPHTRAGCSAPARRGHGRRGVRSARASSSGRARARGRAAREGRGRRPRRATSRRIAGRPSSRRRTRCPACRALAACGDARVRAPRRRLPARDGLLAITDAQPRARGSCARRGRGLADGACGAATCLLDGRGCAADEAAAECYGRRARGPSAGAVGAPRRGRAPGQPRPRFRLARARAGAARAGCMHYRGDGGLERTRPRPRALRRGRRAGTRRDVYARHRLLDGVGTALTATRRSRGSSPRASSGTAARGAACSRSCCRPPARSSSPAASRTGRARRSRRSSGAPRRSHPTDKIQRVPSLRAELTLETPGRRG